MDFDRSGFPALRVQVRRGQTAPGHLILGRLHPGDGKPPVQVADIAYSVPGHPYRMGLMGLQVAAAGSPPWMLTASRPGLSFGQAVLQTMPPEVLARIGGGQPAVFSDLEVADLLRPVLDRVACGELVLAGVAAPPTADPEYTPFTPTMLPHWRFIAGDDIAEPLFAGAMTYMSLRVFTNAEFSFVERCGRKLREMPQAKRTGQEGVEAPNRRYSKARLTQFYKERVEAWPPGRKGPTEDEDWLACKEALSAAVPREAFRKVRQEVAPPAWLKRGPRDPQT